jgi:malonyl-CoA O-methyltransferase
LSFVVNKTSCPVKPALVLIHGWGVDSRIWQPWLASLDAAFDLTCIDLPGYGAKIDENWPESVDQYVRSLLDDLPDQALYVGWSMGGNIAQLIADIAPHRVSGLMLLASNPCFVAPSQDVTSAWPGMEAAVFDQFASGLAVNSAKTLKRFRALQVQGCESPSHLLRTMNALQAGGHASDANLQASLRWLESVDTRRQLASCAVPLLSIWGERDALVPADTASQTTFSGPMRQVRLIPDCGHVPFLSHPEGVTEALFELLSLTLRSKHEVAKKAVADSFSRAANTYDGAAQLQRDVCDEALARIPFASLVGKTVVDLGCGTAYGCQQLLQGGADVIALDLAEGMLRFARNKTVADSVGGSGQLLGWLAADAESLPLADSSVDLIFSSLAIQWCADEVRLMQEIARVLKPGGVFVLSTLGPRTLCELKQAWAAVDGYVHVNRFTPLESMMLSAKQAGFCAETGDNGWWQQDHVEYFGQVREVTRELKHIGAHNVTSGRPKGLTGRHKISTMVAAYEAQRLDDGRLPATYDVIYACLLKPPL